MHPFYRLPVLFFCILLSLKSFATVGITTATGGTGISADKSAGSGSAAFTALGDIVLTSAAATDFTTGTNVTLVLSAPANWQFQAGAGTATGAGNITVNSTVVTGTTITVTYTAGANVIGNKLTISGLLVQATAQTVLASANIVRSATSTGSISGVSGTTNFGSLSQVGGAYVKLQLLLPGESAAPATASGKTGTPNVPVAGTSFNVIVNAVDANWNVTASTNTVTITTSNANVTLPVVSAALAAGTKSFTVTLKTAGVAQTITATDNTSTFTVTSPAVTPVAGAFNKLQVLLPGESAAPGTSLGKTGTQAAQVAGVSFNIIVNAVDANWNLVSSVTDVVHLTSTDINAALPTDAALVGGTQTVSVILKTAASKTITASDVTTPARGANTSSAITVGAAAFAKLQILVPGETASPGSVTGKTGTPTARSAVSPFTVIVNAVDAYWNKVVTVTDLIHFTTTDANPTVPADIALANGTMTFSNKFTLRTPGTTTTITVTDVADGTKSDTSPALTVNPGAFVKLQILLPGETAAPGTTAGKTTNTPTPQVAGSTINITVNAVDAVWNVITSTTDVVHFASTDVNAVLPPNTTLVAGTATLSATVKTAGSRTITVSDVTNPAKTPNTSGSVTVSPGAFVKLQLIVPGETAAAGTATGKTGTPTAASAGTAFAVTVNAVDAYWNKVTSVTDNVQFTTTDSPNGIVPANTALVLGTKTFTNGVNLKTPGTQTITVADTDPTKTANTSPSITVNIGGFAKLQLLLPGEIAAPGTSTGKTSAPPTAPVAGTPLTLTVNAVDAAWNVITTSTDVVNISSNDLNAVLPANAALVSGTKTFSFTFRTATTTRTITATDVTNGTKTPNTSPSMTVAAGAYAQLQILLPSESAAPGTIDGKSGTANPPARGNTFSITVNAVDACFNKVTSISNTVTLTSTDAGATLQAPTALVSGTKQLSVKIVSNATSPYPTITATDGAINTTVSVPGSITPTATTDYFRTKTSGLWNDASIWESSVNGTSGWQDATITPTSAANTITILNTHVVTVSASVTADQIVVQTGGQIIVNSGVTLTIASGGADITGTITNAGAITPTGTLTFLSGGKYQHNTTTSNGTIPAATWNNLSTCEIIGYTSYTGTIAGGNQTFGNFIWNCPNQNVAGSGVSLGGTASVNDLTVTSTGTGNFQLGTAGGTITVRGNFSQSGGTLVLNNTSGTTNFNIAGNVTLSGGAIQKGSGSHLISFNGSATQTYSKTGGTFSSQAINFAINNGATVDFGTSIIDNTSTGTFTLNSGGTIITANDDGLASTGAIGSIQSSGTRTYSTTGNYIYNDAATQSIGSGLPLTVNNLTISAPTATMPATSATYTINGTLTLTGDLDMGTNILGVSATLANSGTGTLKTQATTAPIPTGKTWNVGVEYNGAGADQTIVLGTYNNLTFSQAANKVFAAGTVTVNGNWSSSNGKIDLSNATVAFTGTAQLLDDGGTDSGNGVVFKNVTFGNSGTKKLNSGNFAISSQGLLTMSGTAVLNANNNLTLLSDASGTGSIGQLTSGAIIGNVSVQTFITGGGDLTYRGYRLLSSPVSDPASGNAYYNLTYLKNSGSYLTGSAGGGFDALGAATLYVYREDKLPSASFTSGNYRAITAINNTPAYNLSTIDGNFNMPIGNGYLYFFRGNNGTSTTTVPNDVVLNTSGTVNQGQIVVKNWFNYGSSNLAYSTISGTATVEGFNLVGNPYPSSIDWNTAFAGTTNTGIYAPNTDQTIYIYNATSKNYATYLNTSASGGTGTLGGSNIIPSGQGFFVHALNGSAQLIFNESAKVNAHPGPGSYLLNSAAPLNNQEIRIQLSKDTINKDENVVIFNNNAHDNYALNEDALYLKGSGSVSLCNLSGDKRVLAINQLPFPKKTQSIPLNVRFTASGTYDLSFTALNNFPDIYDVWLVDNYKKDSLDVKHNSTYSFTSNLADTNSFGSKRFSLVLRPNPALTVHLLSFTGTKAANQVKLAWKAENESSYTRYILERSIDGGKNFNTLDSLTSANLGVYNDLDPNPVKGQNIYRLKQIDLIGNISYSSVVPVMYADNVVNNITANLISVYPNPVKSMLNLAITPVTTAATSAANYKITITNTSGSVIKSSTSNNPAWQGDMSDLLPGTYFIQVTNTLQNTLIGKSTFIKL